MKLFFDKSGPTTQVFHTEGDDHYISSHLDAQPLLDSNALWRSDGPRETAVGRKIGSIDPVTYSEWCRQDGINLADFMRWPRQQKAAYLRKKLMDPDWQKFRTVDRL